MKRNRVEWVLVVTQKTLKNRENKDLDGLEELICSDCERDQGETRVTLIPHLFISLNLFLGIWWGLISSTIYSYMAKESTTKALVVPSSLSASFCDV